MRLQGFEMKSDLKSELMLGDEVLQNCPSFWVHKVLLQTVKLGDFIYTAKWEKPEVPLCF